MNKYHESVLLKEIIDFIRVEPGQRYIDATLGGGGHAKEILEKGGEVLGIDLDQDALDYVEQDLKTYITNKKLALVKGNFKDIDKIVRLKNFEKVKGVLFDLGVSSHQIDTPGRGFSFIKLGPLDMRMDTSAPITAEVLVNILAKGELDEIFNKLGQERRFHAISRGIVSARGVKAIKTTEELSGIVQKAYGIRKSKITDFTKNSINKRVFQALRIAVNNELESLEQALPKALKLIDKNGRILVISFHSLEDGIVKRNFKEFERNNMGKIIINKPIQPTDEETGRNPRANSAKLRVFEKN